MSFVSNGLAILQLLMTYMRCQKIHSGMTNFDFRPHMAHFGVHLACQSQVAEMQHFSMAFSWFRLKSCWLLPFFSFSLQLPNLTSQQLQMSDTLRVKMCDTNSKYLSFLVLQFPLSGDIGQEVMGK